MRVMISFNWVERSRDGPRVASCKTATDVRSRLPSADSNRSAWLANPHRSGHRRTSVVPLVDAVRCWFRGCGEHRRVLVAAAGHDGRAPANFGRSSLRSIAATHPQRPGTTGDTLERGRAGHAVLWFGILSSMR